MVAAAPTRPSRLLSVAAAALMLSVTTGCPNKKGSPAAQLATAPDLASETGQTKCGVRASAAKPLVVEWPGADRAALEARATRGLVAVRYSGCEMEVLTNCTVDGAYSYLGLNLKREGVRIKTVDDLYAQLPVGAVGLEGKLERTGQLNVDMVIVGRKEAERSEFNERDLEGRCDEATHVITGITVGAFSFYAGASAEVGAEVKVGNIGAGASSGAEREVLKQDGSEDACGIASQSDEDAPPGCGALLRVEVVPIDSIFGASTVANNGSTTTNSSNSSSSSKGTSDVDPVDQEKWARRRKLWAALTITGYGLTLGGVGGLYAGIAIKNRAESKLGELATDNGGRLPVTDERQQAISRAQTGTGVLIGSIIGMSAGLVLAVFASAKLKQTKSYRGASIGPSLMPRGAGVAARVRF